MDIFFSSAFGPILLSNFIFWFGRWIYIHNTINMFLCRYNTLKFNWLLWAPWEMQARYFSFHVYNVFTKSCWWQELVAKQCTCFIYLVAKSMKNALIYLARHASRVLVMNPFGNIITMRKSTYDMILTEMNSMYQLHVYIRRKGRAGFPDSILIFDDRNDSYIWIDLFSWKNNFIIVNLICSFICNSLIYC